jgi:hypothetical protein
MAQLISTSVTAGPQRAAYPQTINITQQFDQPVYVTEDFAVEFGGNTSQPGAFFVKPVQFLPTQLSYQSAISPFANGRLGILRYNGAITGLFGDPVDLYIGNDYDIYNVNLFPYFRGDQITTTWGNVIPLSAICPNNTNPGFRLLMGAFPRPLDIQPNIYAEGNFYLWVNYTWKPNRESEGIPFVWEPPFYYSWSMYGEMVDNTVKNIPPVNTATARYNICSSGNTVQWDTCGWIQQYPRWRGKIQVWCFCSDVFAEASVPWQYPAVANPTGDLSPYSVFGFSGSDIPLQYYVEHQFAYNAP